MPLPNEEHTQLQALLAGQRQAALATLHAGAPAVSMVAYALDGIGGGFLLHLSALSQHTSDLLNDPRVALLICQTDLGDVNPLTLQRVSIDALAQPLTGDSGDYAAAKTRYLERLPQSAITFTLSDFTLFRLTPSGGRFVAGFGRTYDVAPSEFLT